MYIPKYGIELKILLKMAFLKKIWKEKAKKLCLFTDICCEAIIAKQGMYNRYQYALNFFLGLFYLFTVLWLLL